MDIEKNVTDKRTHDDLRISFYFGFDLMIESRRHIVALSNNKNNNKNK